MIDSTQRRRKTLLSSLICGIAFSGTLLLCAEAAMAGRGRCTGTARGRSLWFLGVAPTTPTGFVNVKFTAVQDSRNPGGFWRWDMYRSSTRIASGGAGVSNPSRSFDVVRKTRDLDGTTLYEVRAENVRTGELCRGVALF
jgi:hypothetical protein